MDETLNQIKPDIIDSIDQILKNQREFKHTNETVKYAILINNLRMICVMSITIAHRLDNILGDRITDIFINLIEKMRSEFDDLELFVNDDSNNNIMKDKCLFFILKTTDMIESSYELMTSDSYAKLIKLITGIHKDLNDLAKWIETK
jgi:hypothetical protein